MHPEGGEIVGNPRRYAYEEYVRSSDQWYWNRTKELVAETAKKTAALVAASTAVSLLALFIAVSSQLRKFR